MNGKKSKALRRLAERATVGSPAVAYDTKTGIPPKFELMRNPMNHFDQPVVVKTAKGIPLRLSTCTRDCYKGLKRGS